MRTQSPRKLAIPHELGPVAPRLPGIFERRASAGRRVDDDFVIGVDVEHGGIEPLLPREHRLDAHLVRATGGRIEPEIESRAGGVIGHFRERRRLEPPAIACVQVDIGGRMIDKAGDRTRVAKFARTAVVGIGRRDIVVVRAIAHDARANAERRRECRQE